MLNVIVTLRDEEQMRKGSSIVGPLAILAMFGLAVTASAQTQQSADGGRRMPRNP